MKKAAGIILKVLGGLILLILLLIFTVPVIFKVKIRTKVEQEINESVNAKVSEDGSPNWDIVKDTTTVEPEAEITEPEEEGEPSELKVLLKKFAVQNSSIS